MMKTVSYAAEENEGPRLLILGAVHGNEKCGTQAITRLITEIENGDVRLARGSVTLVPITNPRAFAKDKRYDERNLNRFLVPMEKPDCYEAKIGNILCPMLRECDYLLDLHSYKGQRPFIFVGKNDIKGHEFAANLGEHMMVTGWADAYKASGRVESAESEESTGTTEYARRFGATSVTLECGNNKDPHSAEIAYAAIRNAMRYLALTDEPPIQKKMAEAAKLVTVRQVIYREDEGGSFAKDWKHLDTVAKGEVIATTGAGKLLKAPRRGVIVMPDAKSPVGEEWFYFGTRERTPWYAAMGSMARRRLTAWMHKLTR